MFGVAISGISMPEGVRRSSFVAAELVEAALLGGVIAYFPLLSTLSAAAQ
jgi:hypothetical protein